MTCSKQKALAKGSFTALVFCCSAVLAQMPESEMFTYAASGNNTAQAWDLRALAPQQSAATWENCGPTGYGRVWEVVVDSTNDQIVYLLGSSGAGLWKSTNGGGTWTFISRDMRSQSMGDLVIDPRNNQHLWMGTGECLAGGGSLPYPGTGVYKSENGGTSWIYKGLEKSYYIARMAIHPTNSNTVFAAVMGSLYSNNPERGLYRTTDGGTTWQQVLKADDSTGCSEVLVHPTNPNRVFACMWTAMRYPYNRIWSSNATRMYRSDDGGTTWALQAGGFPTSDLGRHTLTICKSNPNIMYCVAMTGANPPLPKGVYKSTDGGMNWSRTAGQPASSIYSYYGHTFCQIRCNPHDANDVVALGIYTNRTTNGGSTWANTFPTSLHMDFHGVAWSRQNRNLMYEGDDGGIARSTDGGRTFTYLARGSLAQGAICISQMYAFDIAQDDANFRIAGQQDEGTNYTLTGGSLYADWRNAIGGDGFDPRIDQGNTQYAIGSLQYGGYYRTSNRTSWSRISISGRLTWDCPAAFDSVTGRAYIAGEAVWTAPRGSGTFTKISADLTNGDHSVPQYPYGSISALAAFRGNQADVVCYAGTDDGNVWVSRNASTTGATWTKIRNGLVSSAPASDERRRYDGWIKEITIDQADPTGATAYVAVWYFRWGWAYHYKPKLFKLTNYGLGGLGSADWKDISGDLPSTVTTNRVVVDHAPTRNGWLYCATDFGMYYSTNSGVNWAWLGDQTLPIVACNDLTIHRRTNYLYICTYGRGLNRINLNNVGPVTSVKADLVAKGFQTLGNYPNPVVGKTTIRFRVKDRQKVMLAIYDMSGQLVNTIAEKTAAANAYQTVTWNRTNSSGSKVAAGNYVCRLIGEKVTLAKTVIVK
ncbi:MAG: T9SS type A sorting domain-containing protein [Chitinispirillaceae bacterium]|nr:T9SS type A sorting domain-containing protein [Chitinispirillaceae bacterium]